MNISSLTLWKHERCGIPMTSWSTPIHRPLGLSLFTLLGLLKETFLAQFSQSHQRVQAQLLVFEIFRISCGAAAVSFCPAKFIFVKNSPFDFVQQLYSVRLWLISVRPKLILLVINSSFPTLHST